MVTLARSDQVKKDGNTPYVGFENARSPQRLKKSGILRIVILACIGLLIGVALVVWFINAQKFEGTDDAYVTGHNHPMSFRVSGTVAEVLIDDNEHVSAGQTLAKLDPRDFEVRLKQNRASLQAAQAELEQAEAQIAQADAQLQQAQAQADAARAKLDDSRRIYERSKQLFQSGGAISKQDYDNAQFQFQQDQATFNSGNAAVRVAQAGLKAANTRRAAALAQIAQGTEGVENAKLQLSYTILSAPTLGHVTNKSLETGQRVQFGQSVMAIVEPNVWIVANFKETQLGRVRPGQPVEISVDAIRGKKFTGKVDSFQSGTGAVFALLPPDNATGNFTKIVQRVPVKIIFDRQSIENYQSQIVPGLSVEVSVRVE